MFSVGTKGKAQLVAANMSSAFLEAGKSITVLVIAKVLSFVPISESNIFVFILVWC